MKLFRRKFLKLTAGAAALPHSRAWPGRKLIPAGTCG